MEGFYLGNPRVNATSFRAKERGLRETGGIRLVIAVISTAVLWTRGCQGFSNPYSNADIIVGLYLKPRVV